MSNTPYKRVLLKLSGEGLRGSEPSGFDASVLSQLGDQLEEIRSLGVSVGVVIGGGNFIRGSQIHSQMEWFPHAAAHGIGMLATVMNGLALREFLLHRGLPVTLLSAISIEGTVQRYSLEAMRSAFQRGDIVIFVGGTGHPFFTTDTTAALRAKEMDAELLIKATQVDGVYSADPHKDPNAIRYERLSYLQVLAENLRVMDSTSISFCGEYKIPILVVNVGEKDNLKRAIMGESVGTLIDHSDS